MQIVLGEKYWEEIPFPHESNNVLRNLTNMDSSNSFKNVLCFDQDRGGVQDMFFKSTTELCT